MMTMLLMNGVANKNTTRSDKPWIHLRAILAAKFWMGLAIFSAVRNGASLAGWQQYSLADAVCA
jgi:hypothetical protein